MARSSEGQPRKRFSKSGHTAHQPGGSPPPAGHRAPGGYQPPPPGYRSPPGYGAPPYSSDPDFGSPTYHQRTTGGRPGKAPRSGVRQIGRSAIGGTNRAARAVTRSVIQASKADGADESGLTALIWNQVLSYGTDAMITVALAGTVFFGASASAQRGNVLLYLLVTMAPFAVVAPIIGPALDRLQHGRRWTMAATGIGRGVLALIMAAHSTNLFVLYPCALGSLVFSKAYAVVRAAAAPRLVPKGLSLTEANARLTIFGLGSTIVLGGFVGVLIKLSGSYSFGLVVTAIGFFACAFFAFRLPKQVDSAAAPPRPLRQPARPKGQQPAAPLSRIGSWARRGFEPHLLLALQGESALRLLAGLLTIYLAFYVQSTEHGATAASELALVVGAAGAGNFVGTALGTRLKLARPEVIITLDVCAAGAVCLLIALTFSPLLAAVGMFIAAVANALSKIALDALVQRDVGETLRSSAFARTETFLQLAWVVGATVAVLLPSNDRRDGAIAFLVAGVVTASVGVVAFLRGRAMAKTTAVREWPERPGQPGSVVPRSVE